MECVKWDDRHNTSCWYGRVPTQSTIADGPSRMLRDDVTQRFGANVVKPVLPRGYRRT